MSAILKYLAIAVLFISAVSSVQAQMIAVSGFIHNSETGEAVKSANVLEKNKGIGTISRSDGYYQLLLKPGNTNLGFSMEGFETFHQNLILKNDTTLLIQLHPRHQTRTKTKHALVTEDGLPIGHKKDFFSSGKILN